MEEGFQKKLSSSHKKKTVCIVYELKENSSSKENRKFLRFLENLKKQLLPYVNVCDTETTSKILLNGGGDKIGQQVKDDIKFAHFTNALDKIKSPNGKNYQRKPMGTTEPTDAKLTHGVNVLNTGGANDIVSIGKYNQSSKQIETAVSAKEEMLLRALGFELFPNGKDNQSNRQVDNDRSTVKAAPAMTLIHNDTVEETLTKPHVMIPSGHMPLLSPPHVLIYFLNEAAVTKLQCRDILKKAATTDIPVIMVREKAFNESVLESITQLDPDLNTSLKENETIVTDNGHSIEYTGELKVTRELSSFDRYHEQITCASNNDGCSLSSVIRRGFNNAVVYSINEADKCIGRLLVELSCYIDDIKHHRSNNSNTDIVVGTLSPVNQQLPLIQVSKSRQMSQKRHNGYHVTKHSVNGSLQLPQILPSKPKDPRVRVTKEPTMSTKVENRIRKPSLQRNNGKVVDSVTEYNKSLILPPLDNRPHSASNIVPCDNNRFAKFSTSANVYMQKSHHHQYNAERTVSMNISTEQPLRSVSANDLGTGENMNSSSPPLFDSGLTTKTFYLVMRKYNSVPELLVWPPDGGEEHRMSTWDFLSDGSDTDDGLSFSVDIDWDDIHSISNSSTPEVD